MVGHSLGGLVALQLFPRVAGPLPRLVLVDPPLEMSTEERQAVLDGTLADFAAPKTAKEYMDGNPRWTEKDAVIKVYGEAVCDRGGVAAILEDNDPWSFTHLIPPSSSGTEVIILGAQNDPAFSPAEVSALAQVRPDVKTFVVPYTSHSIHPIGPVATRDTSLGLLLGVTLTAGVYLYIAHATGLTLISVEEPWRTLLVVTGGAGFSAWSGSCLIALSKPAPLQSWRQLRVLFNLNLPAYLYLVMMTLTSNGTPKEHVCPPCPSDKEANPVIMVGILIGTVGFCGLILGNALLYEKIVELQRSGTEPGPRKAEEEKNTQNEGEKKE
ncbi:hypothetical protein RQP46_009086 [Phenoliferia psychrophenolica]